MPLGRLHVAEFVLHLYGASKVSELGLVIARHASNPRVEFRERNSGDAARRIDHELFSLWYAAANRFEPLALCASIGKFVHSCEGNAARVAVIRMHHSRLLFGLRLRKHFIPFPETCQYHPFE